MNINLDNKELIWLGKPFKKLTFGLTKTGGRNTFGRICSFRKGGGQKKNYRKIDFLRNRFLNLPAIVCRIEYDPNKTGYTALICYKNGYMSYINSLNGLKVGSYLINNDFILKDIKASNKFLNYSTGNSFYLCDVPFGSIISNIEIVPNKGASLCRAAGSFGIILGLRKLNNINYILIRLPSGFEYLVSPVCRCVMGSVSNSIHIMKKKKKAGQSRLLGIRPIVRGVAMNPVDHPHGGGEGKKSPKRAHRSFLGKIIKGKPTRKKFKFSNKFIIKKKYI